MLSGVSSFVTHQLRHANLTSGILIEQHSLRIEVHASVGEEALHQRALSVRLGLTHRAAPQNRTTPVCTSRGNPPVLPTPEAITAAVHATELVPSLNIRLMDAASASPISQQLETNSLLHFLTDILCTSETLLPSE